MNDYQPPVAEQLPSLPAFAQADTALLTQVMEEAGKFVATAPARMSAA